MLQRRVVEQVLLCPMRICGRRHDEYPSRDLRRDPAAFQSALEGRRWLIAFCSSNDGIKYELIERNDEDPGQSSMSRERVGNNFMFVLRESFIRGMPQSCDPKKLCI